MFHPIPKIEPIHDVVFAGNNIGGKPRMKVIEFLHKNCNLYIIGAGWPKKFNQLGRKTGFVELNRLLNSAKVTVDIFNLYDIVAEGTSHYTSNRPYQNMAVSRPHIQPYCSGVEEFFEHGYLNYKSLDHLKTQIEILLNISQKKRDEIGSIQRKEIVTRHTYAHAWANMEKIIEKDLF